MPRSLNNQKNWELLINSLSSASCTDAGSVLLAINSLIGLGSLIFFWFANDSKKELPVVMSDNDNSEILNILVIEGLLGCHHYKD